MTCTNVRIGRWRLHFFFLLLGLGLVASGHAGTLAGSFSSIATGSNVNLTAVGKLDWAQWGLFTAGTYTHKVGVIPQISNFSLVGDNSSYTLEAYQYTNNYSGYTWFDGTPVASFTNTTTGVWAYDYNPIGSGFQLTVPADENEKTLLVYVGAFAAEGKFTATLSDGSASGFTNTPTQTVNNLANGPGGVFAIKFAANSSNQMLTVTWTLQKINGSPLNAPNVTLQAAALTATNADNPPYISITSPTGNPALPEPADITLQAEAQDFDGTVTNVSFYQGTNKIGETTASPYNVTWSNVARGHYFLTASATDNAGVTSVSQPLEVFVYGADGGQTNSITAPPAASVDLTSEGTLDWVHWGITSSTDFDCKASVPLQISNFTVLGTNAVQQFSGNYTSFSWSDGTPTVSSSGTDTGVYITGMTNGFRITAPADSSARQIRVYVGGYGVQGEFQAWLSDFSGQPLIDPATVSNEYGNTYVDYTINYRAASPNQQLIVVYRAVNLFDPVYGNVTLQAATLQGSGSSTGLLPFQIQNPQMSANNLVFTLPTQLNHNYTVQYSYSLNPVAWQTLTNIAGTGSSVTVTSQDVTNPACFYRVMAQ